MSTRPVGERIHERWTLAWLLLTVFYFAFGFLYSVIQPLTALPDESAQMEYVRFLATEHRLPRWTPTGNGEGGYETQHPPLAYAVQAIPYRLTAALPESMRWHTVRWFMIALGASLIPVMARLGRWLFPGQPLFQFTLAGTVQLLPLSLMYFSHANPDGIALLLSAIGLLLAAGIYRRAEEPSALPCLAGGVAALAGLTKLTALPVLPLVLAGQWFRPGQSPSDRTRRCVIIAAVWLAGCGWWYGRNQILYGHPFLHTTGKMGTGLDLAGKYGPHGMAIVAWPVLRETFLSLWVQRDWFPASWDSWLYGGIELFVALAVTGFLVRRHLESQEDSSRFLLRLAAVLTLTAVAAHQLVFWLVDMELNTGGRYLLPALPMIAVLLVSGVRRLGPAISPAVCCLWIALLVLMNIASAYNITTWLVPRYFPGWSMFEFPPGARP